ncbi:hypothetical protein EV356DRAFT_530644 [Viridothelium virens]|uniref:Galactose oxidase n=1 Tax=Viridothelium virens TaxID=1048519 RepID=A0A6A6HF41_VIRVR|nr:hypothetical protein EV356DRAFT_530644 [Viridothelium virens]
MAESAVAAALYGVETLAEGVVLAAKGLYDPTLPLQLSFEKITTVPVARTSHSIVVIKNRAYIFGGESAPGTRATNDVQLVELPTSDVGESADQKTVEARPAEEDGRVPEERIDHAAVAIDDCFYMLGGRTSSSSTEPLEEDGRVWMFSTKTSMWSCLQPIAQSPKPPPRYNFAIAASVQPEISTMPTDHDTAPQFPPDPANVVPEPLDPSHRGTIVVSCGNSVGGTLLNDCWAFDIRSRTWSPLPPPQDDPALACYSSSLALDDNELKLYSCFGRTNSGDLLHMRTLDLEAKSSPPPASTQDNAASTFTPCSILSAASSDWQDATSKSPSTSPTPRSAASLIPVTTGQGRTYLLALGGHSTSASPSAASPLNASSTQFAELELVPHGDAFAYQLPSESATAAGAKDVARKALRSDSAEGKWAEVKYLDGEVKMVQEGQAGRGFGKRMRFAAAKASEVDGGSVVVWGGVDEKGQVCGDGWIVSVKS